MNLADVFLKTVAAQPEHPAILGPGTDDIWTYQQLADLIDSTANKLRDAGIGAGNTVGLFYPSGREYIVNTYALWRCGASVVPIGVELTAEEKQDICTGIFLTGVITLDSAADVFVQYQDDAPIPITDGVVFLRFKPGQCHPEGFVNLNPAFLRFSSGTTGASKGVILSHETIYDRIHAANLALNLGPEDRVVWLLSMTYHFAVSIVAYLSFGTSIILCQNHFGSTIVKTTARHRGTFIYGSPVHYDLMSHDRSNTMLPEVRLAISTAMYLRNEIAESFQIRFNLYISEAYGIIEIGLPCINHDNPREKRGSVGKVLPNFDIKIEDVGFGEELGTINIKGKGVLDAYYNPWAPRSDIMPDGWFATGDLGYLDEEGYLFIQGRSKEIINTGGMKFFPQEVETVLESHPSIKEACVFSHKDKRMGEIPYARIVRESDSSEQLNEKSLIDYCAIHLAPYKLPEKIEVVEELAHTASGKLIRQDLTIKRN